MPDQSRLELHLKLLREAGVTQAAEEPLDLKELTAELEVTETIVKDALAHLEGLGLLDAGTDEEIPPLLLPAGRQFLEARGSIPEDVLHFLPRVVDDLHAREALLRAGSVLVDRFRFDLLAGRHAEHAKELVPPAFAEAVDDTLAVNLFAAAVALMARLSDGAPAGCVAEEIIAARLVMDASAELDVRAEQGELTAEEAEAAKLALNDIFDLFGDDDVLLLFDMQEPADAALGRHTRSTSTWASPTSASSTGSDRSAGRSPLAIWTNRNNETLRDRGVRVI